MYESPSWGAEPASKVVLEEILNGVGKGDHVISNKSTVSVGRNPEMCDVCLEDPFMSRKHAIFQHGSGGRIAIWDLGSTHGTWVNNQRIPSGQFVDLHSGAVIRFGPNTEHLFFLIGGPEPQEVEEAPQLAVGAPQFTRPESTETAVVNKEKEALDKYLKEQSSKSYKEVYEELLARELTPKQKQERQNQPQYDRTAVTWGMVDDEIIYADKSDQEVIRTDLLRALPNLLPRHLAKIEDFEKKQKKMKAMIRDFNKIFELEEKGTKLTADQFQIKKDIEERMNKLSGEMAVAEDKLKQMFGIDHNKTFKFRKEMRREDNEDDEFFDRTARDTTRDKQIESEDDAETAAEVSKALRKEAEKVGHQGLMTNLGAVNNEIASIKEWLLEAQNKQLQREGKAEEDLDMFIKEQQAEEQRSKVKKLKELMKESDRLVAMLRFVQPEFNKQNFDEQHQRLEDERRVKEIFREQERERRRRIFEAMEKRNAELAGNALQQQTPVQTAEVWDSIENDEEELARLGKRVKKQVEVAKIQEREEVEAKKYTVSSKPASRDDESEPSTPMLEDEPGQVMSMSNEPKLPLVQSEDLEAKLEKMRAKQKSLGY